MADPKFVFHDHSLMETVREGNPEAQTFFLLLALCHTVMPEEKKEGERPLMDFFVTTWQVATEALNSSSVLVLTFPLLSNIHPLSCLFFFSPGRRALLSGSVS